MHDLGTQTISSMRILSLVFCLLSMPILSILSTLKISLPFIIPLQKKKLILLVLPILLSKSCFLFCLNMTTKSDKSYALFGFELLQIYIYIHPLHKFELCRKPYNQRKCDQMITQLLTQHKIDIRYQNEYVLEIIPSSHTIQSYSLYKMDYTWYSFDFLNRFKISLFPHYCFYSRFRMQI